jgi:hypothetical protein
VLATDAIDHSQVDPRLPDLSHADFEFIGSTDVNNPAVPNLISLGPYEAYWVLGHGLLPGEPGRVIYFVADSLDPTTLPTTRLFNEGLPVPRIPRGKILDVFSSVLVPDLEAAASYPRCPEAISPVFDRQTGNLLEVGFPRTNTIVRRAFGQLPDGTLILQRTRATAIDFVLSARLTPGTAP